MKKQAEFFDEYNISRKAYENTGLKWNDLTKIHDDYTAYKEQLEPFAIYIFNSLMKAPGVHSVRYRIKNPEHLVEKIIRKKIQDKNSNITIDNYKSTITDLIGLRALHLFKDGWEPIHSFVSDTWELKQAPVANHRKGDSEEITSLFRKKGCVIKEHPYGYRSIHYIIESKPDRNTLLAEIQVRTIFEEAWSEIDHTIRYPYQVDNKLFKEYLFILNRLAGGADEMGSFIKTLQKELRNMENEFATQLKEKNEIIEALQNEISSLNVQGKKLKTITDQLESLKMQPRITPLGKKITAMDFLQSIKVKGIEKDVTLYERYLKSKR